MQQTRTILSILVQSDTTVSITELVDAIAIDPQEDPGFDPKNRMPIPRELLKLCSSLVVVSKTHRPLFTWDEDDSGDEVRLAHFSVKEYLLYGHVSEAYQPWLDETVARVHLAKLCLTYLISVSQLLSYLADQDMSWHLGSIYSKFPFVRYSGQYWMYHAQGVETEDEDFWRMLTSFFLERPEALYLAKLVAPDSSYLGQWADKPPISFASYWGLTKVVEYLINNGAGFADTDTTKTHVCLDHAFQVASAGGHDEIVQLLLDRGADVNSKRDYALIHASIRGHDTTVQMLLDNGANIQAGRGNLLRSASFFGRDTVIQVLLDGGADVNAGDSAALIMASQEGHETIVQLLLDRGANVNAQDGAALRFAAECGQYSAVQLLLDAGADANAGNGDALVKASKRGCEPIVQLLINEGADVNAQDDAALRRASKNGAHSVVQLLLAAGADINSRDKRGRNALTEALEEGRYATVKLLLENDALLTMEDLIYALRQEQPWAKRSMVSVMLPYITAELAAERDRGGRNILHCAAACGSKRVVRKCLDLDIDVQARDHRRDTALHHAAYYGHLSIVKALVHAGCDLKAVDKAGRTPLHLLANVAPGQRWVRSCDRGRRRRRESSRERCQGSRWDSDGGHKWGRGRVKRRRSR